MASSPPRPWMVLDPEVPLSRSPPAVAAEEATAAKAAPVERANMSISVVAMVAIFLIFSASFLEPSLRFLSFDAFHCSQAFFGIVPFPTASPPLADRVANPREARSMTARPRPRHTSRPHRGRVPRPQAPDPRRRPPLCSRAKDTSKPVNIFVPLRFRLLD